MILLTSSESRAAVNNYSSPPLPGPYRVTPLKPEPLSPQQPAAKQQNLQANEEINLSSSRMSPPSSSPSLLVERKAGWKKQSTK